MNMQMLFFFLLTMFIAALPAVCRKDSCCFDFGCICSFLAVHKVIRCCSDTDLQFSCHLLETKAALLFSACEQRKEHYESFPNVPKCKISPCLQRKPSLKDFKSSGNFALSLWCGFFFFAISTILVLWLNTVLTAAFFPSEPTRMVTCSLWCDNYVTVELWSNVFVV